MVPENVKGNTQAVPAAGPDTVVQVVDGEAVVVVVVTGEVLVVVAGDPQTL